MLEFKILPFKKSHLKQVFNILMDSQYDHYKAHMDYFLPPETTEQVLLDFLNGILNKRKNFGFVAVSLKDINEVWGFVVCERTSNLENKRHIKKMYVQDIAVKKSIQGKGIGKALMDAVKKKALSEDIHQIELCVFNNVNVKSFYKKLGYKPVFETFFMDIPFDT